jgi:hypothetical protein
MHDDKRIQTQLVFLVLRMQGKQLNRFQEMVAYIEEFDSSTPISPFKL